jgi:UDP-N-acetylglucosamine 4,6-dehydratase
MNERILVTGGTGFLGRRLALALKKDYSVFLCGRNNKQNLFAEKFTGCKVLPMDVSNIETVRDAFTEVKPEVVIHAAATKFVDLAELQPMECVDVNVTGSQNVARVAVEKGVKTVIGISTDKATPPVRNIYGLSKAIMERMFCSMNGKSDTRFACVRYGNVAWSTGSVLPIWKKMHDETTKIGTTGPEMRRFFFTVTEAVNLVMTALRHIETCQGKVLSRAMKSAQIEDILKLWIEEKGGAWEKIQGRPGERNDEYLVGEIELPYATEIMFNDIVHYLIAFNTKSAVPLNDIVYSANAPRLTREEILELILHPPLEEL